MFLVLNNVFFYARPEIVFKLHWPGLKYESEDETTTIVKLQKVPLSLSINQLWLIWWLIYSI